MCSYFHTGLFYSIAYLILEKRSVSSIYIYVISVSPGVPPCYRQSVAVLHADVRPRQPAHLAAVRAPAARARQVSRHLHHQVQIFFAEQKYFEESCNMRCSISAPLPLTVWKTYRRTSRSPFNRKLFLSSPNLPKRSTTESPPPRPNEVLLMEFSSCAFI